ncbi:DBH-like monooxygenase protein 1 homolog [Liolophura sinensis]|uniref:DBH-like monooxygenase protein 1 homolog n=1 Tax=Liolophura sinensis TaxID=3198878 RepID=UPI0031580450
MRLYLLLTLVALARGYPYFQDRIPNGPNVQHPCKSHLTWAGVGHFNAPGGGKRNPFGLDFKAEGFKWTPHLCGLDSDHDGRTNGEELGDPDCVWTPGATPSRTENISHPGICQPIDSAHCLALQADDFKCAEYSCPYIDAPNVKKLDLKFPTTKVPAKETTYICKVFNGPTDNPYHAIAFAPIEDNKKILHHMLLFGCVGENIHESEVHECGMTENQCLEILGAWTIGMEGFCLPPDVGVSFGKGYFTHFAIQIHWNNPEKRADYYDGSGMSVYYMPHIRPIEGSSVLTGQLNINVPPMKNEVIHQGSCAPFCTRKLLPHAINITSALLHMHYLGIRGSFKQFRNGRLIRTIAEDDYYFYESPNLYVFEPPVEFLPGDEWQTECVYQTAYGFRKRNYTIYYGDSTQDEMCYTFFTYYPRIPNLKACDQIGDIDLCETWNQRGCDWRRMQAVRLDVMSNAEYAKHCDVISGTHCTPQCMAALRPLLDDGCMQGTFGFYIRHSYFRQVFNGLMKAILACDKVISGPATTLSSKIAPPII